MGEWAGQSTFFLDRIWLGLAGNGVPEMDIARHYYESTYFKKFGGNLLSDPIEVSTVPVCCGEVTGGAKFITWDYLKPKLHTMREDLFDRWHAGRDIQFAINPRSRNYFQFAPTLPCISTQQVDILEMVMTSSSHCYQTQDSRVWAIDVDGIRLKRTQIEELAINDGFESVEQFFTWFNKTATYKLIHWTTLKYI